MPDATVIVSESQEALLAAFNVLVRASNRTNDRAEFRKLKAKRDALMLKLDRIAQAQINESVPPPEVQEALARLVALTASLAREQERIRNATEKLDRVESYLAVANDVLQIVGRLLAFA